jgi:hypothetical protein
MPNWTTDGVAVVWDEDAPDPVDQEPIEGIDLGETYPAPDDEGEGEFKPAKHTIDDVKKYVDAHPDEAQRILDAEVDGKNRTSLVDWLTAE